MRRSIRKATPLNAPSPVIAVKFIHRAYALRHGRVTQKQIEMEIALHTHMGQHTNIIQLFSSGQDAIWTWIAMEYADGGDLFDKIEADVGVAEDIAHVYFTQLVSAVGYMHSKGVAHRDIKPENILLSSSGYLKLADFGLATLFSHRGSQKLCTTLCGSPPYIAPEVITCSKSTHTGRADARAGYAANRADIWSCGVVLFVLLVGNTPWEEPTSSSWEYNEYVRGNGRSADDLWQKPSPSTVSLLRGMMKLDPSERFTLEEVRKHPWFTRPNPYLGSNDKLRSPVSLATKMLESLKIDLNQRLDSIPSSLPSSLDVDMADSSQPSSRLASTQPQTPTGDMLFDWEAAPDFAFQDRVSSSQPVGSGTITKRVVPGSDLWERFSEEPSMSQFSSSPGLALSLTQRAKKFQDIVPPHSLTRFISHLTHNLLLPLLSQALHHLGIPASGFTPSALQGLESAVCLKVLTKDDRRCPLKGNIVVEKTGIEGEREGEELLEVRFVKFTGDPLEWRRLFKRVVLLCKEGIFVPGERG